MAQIELFDNVATAPQMKFDVTSRKHKGAETSAEANLRTNKSRDCQRIIDYLKGKPNQESYLNEIVRDTGIPIQTASARRADLLTIGAIYKTGKKKEKCGIVRLTER